MESTGEIMKIEKITLYTSVDWRGFAIDGIMCPAVQKVIREKGGVTILDHDDEVLLEINPNGKEAS